MKRKIKRERAKNKYRELSAKKEREHGRNKYCNMSE